MVIGPQVLHDIDKDTVLPDEFKAIAQKGTKSEIGREMGPSAPWGIHGCSASGLSYVCEWVFAILPTSAILSS